MEKIIVEIVVPALGRSFDFELPAQSSGKDVTTHSAMILQKLNPGLNFQQPELYDIETGTILTDQAMLAASGVRDGSRLMLA